MSEFVVKDSGQRQEMGGGMVRDTEEGKVDYTYVLSGPMLDRWAIHLMKGAEKYDRDNWMKGVNFDTLERYKRSALRHLIQWLRGDRSEDHAAAVFFNLNGAEYVREQLSLPAEVGDTRSQEAIFLARMMESIVDDPMNQAADTLMEEWLAARPDFEVKSDGVTEWMQEVFDDPRR